jgi:hypothetical protein
MIREYASILLKIQDTCCTTGTVLFIKDLLMFCFNVLDYIVASY